MASDASKQFSQLSHDFNKVVEELKGTSPLVEELVARAGKLQRHFDATSSALLGFLEAVQKIADVAGAASAYGGASDLGTCLTKIALRHRAIAEQYTALSSKIGEDMCKNLPTRMELRRKTLLAVEKEHDKDYKRWKVDLKKRNESNLKLASKAAAKKKERNVNIHEKLEESLEDSVELYEDFQTFEQSSLRKVLLEERKHYCAILSSISPVMEAEVSVLDEVYHLQELSCQCKLLNESYECLPAHSEQAVNNLQLDLSRLFKEAPCQSPAIAQARKSHQQKRNSFLSLASDAMSMDTVSLSSSINPAIGSDNSSAAVSVGTDVSSPSLNAIRLDPDGCTASLTPEPMYADIDGMQDMCTPVARHQPSSAENARAETGSLSGGSGSDLQNTTSKSSLGSVNNQPVNPFGRPTAGDDATSSISSLSAPHMTLTRTSAKDSLAQLAKVVPPVAPKPPTRSCSQLKDQMRPDEALYADAGDPAAGAAAAPPQWPEVPALDDLPSPPPLDELDATLLVEPPTPTPKQPPPPIMSKPSKQKAFAQSRFSQSLDVLYSETRAALAYKKPVDTPAPFEDVDESFPPPPPPEDYVYEAMMEPPPPPPPAMAAAPLPCSISMNNLQPGVSASLPVHMPSMRPQQQKQQQQAYLQNTSMGAPQQPLPPAAGVTYSSSMGNVPGIALPAMSLGQQSATLPVDHRSSTPLSRDRSGSAGSQRSWTHRLPAGGQAHRIRANTLGPYDPSHTISMDV